MCDEVRAACGCMSNLVNNIANLGRKINKYDPLDRAVQNFALGKPAPGRKFYGEPQIVTPIPGVPNIDNAANQQSDQMRRRRGVLANIYAGQGASAAPVATKTLLGS